MAESGNMAMDGGRLHEIALAAARRLAGAEQGRPFGPDYDVFKVGGKIFMMLTEVPGQRIVTVKCDEHRSMILREAFTGIAPGYHMNKRHWISISPSADITEDLVRDLVRQSYELVIIGVPRAKRP